VPQSLGDLTTTPIEFEAQKGSNDFSIDISKYK